jgi:hypothetical protein
MQMQLSTDCESVANEIGHLTALAVQVDDMTAGEAMKVYLYFGRRVSEILFNLSLDECALEAVSHGNATVCAALCDIERSRVGLWRALCALEFQMIERGLLSHPGTASDVAQRTASRLSEHAAKSIIPQICGIRGRCPKTSIGHREFPTKTVPLH